MGCCPSSDEEVVVELNDVTNAAVQCNAGMAGKNTLVKRTEAGDYHISGQGTMVGSCSLDCDIAFWEVKLLREADSVQVGLAKFNPKRPVPLEGELTGDNDGKGAAPQWVLKREFLPQGQKLQEGDVVGVHWDQTDFPMVCFTLNGVFLPNASITRIRPAQDIYPAVSVSGKGEAEARFAGGTFEFKPMASKFTPIVCATNLI